MSGSTTGIVAIVVVAAVALALMLILIVRAARRPAQEHPQHDPMRGLVQGGQHVGGGRSVAPTRAAYGHRPPVEDRGNPLDLE
jgi:hypothetical protein